MDNVAVQAENDFERISHHQTTKEGIHSISNFNEHREHDDVQENTCSRSRGRLTKEERQRGRIRVRKFSENWFTTLFQQASDPSFMNTCLEGGPITPENSDKKPLPVTFSQEPSVNGNNSLTENLTKGFNENTHPSLNGETKPGPSGIYPPEENRGIIRGAIEYRAPVNKTEESLDLSMLNENILPSMLDRDIIPQIFTNAMSEESVMESLQGVKREPIIKQENNGSVEPHLLERPIKIEPETNGTVPVKREYPDPPFPTKGEELTPYPPFTTKGEDLPVDFEPPRKRHKVDRLDFRNEEELRSFENRAFIYGSQLDPINSQLFEDDYIEPANEPFSQQEYELFEESDPEEESSCRGYAHVPLPFGLDSRLSAVELHLGMYDREPYPHPIQTRFANIDFHILYHETHNSPVQMPISEPDSSEEITPTCPDEENHSMRRRQLLDQLGEEFTLEDYRSLRSQTETSGPEDTPTEIESKKDSVSQLEEALLSGKTFDNISSTGPVPVVLYKILRWFEDRVRTLEEKCPNIFKNKDVVVRYLSRQNSS